MHPALRKMDALFFLPFFAYLVDFTLILGHPAHSIAARFPSLEAKSRQGIYFSAPAPVCLLSLSERDGEEQGQNAGHVCRGTEDVGVVRLVRDLRGLYGVSGGKCAWKAQITCCFYFKGLFLFLSLCIY
jgi:hypothetical protein